MPVRTELTLRLPNSPGALADVCRTLAVARVNILVLLLEPGGQLRLVVDNVVRAEGALRERRHKVTPRDVLVIPVPHAPGALAAVLTLAFDAGLNIEYAYAGGGDNGSTAMAVLGVDDPIRAGAAAGI